MPAPIFWVEPMRTRTWPDLTRENSCAFWASVGASCMNATSSGGTPRETRRRLRSSYTLNEPSPLGVDRSQNTSWASRLSAVSSQMRRTLSAHAATFPRGFSGRDPSTSLWSRASFLPSLVILSMLSTDGSTDPFRTRSARSERPATSSRWIALGSTRTFR